jgi:hypothetical protein
MCNVEAGRFVALRQREGRAWNIKRWISGEVADQGAGERRLAGSEIAFEAKRISGLEEKSDVVGKTDDAGLGQIAEQE